MLEINQWFANWYLGMRIPSQCNTMMSETNMPKLVALLVVQRWLKRSMQFWDPFMTVQELFESDSMLFSFFFLLKNDTSLFCLWFLMPKGAASAKYNPHNTPFQIKYFISWNILLNLTQMMIWASGCYWIFIT